MISRKELINNIKSKAQKVSPRVRVLDKASEIADIVLTKEEKYSKMSMPELRNLSYRMQDEIQAGANLDNYLIDALAIAREVIFRVHGLKAYKVQLIGAIVAHFGDFAEMKTGEGKTLTLLLVSYVNALSKKGVHIVTVNEYLVERDMKFSEEALSELGISVGFILSSMRPEQKKQMYARDITYVSNSELGFDYLRDNMVQSMNEKMQRELNFAIVDEADSVLIDEARTPLIIAGNPDENLGKYIEVDSFVKSLSPNDYVIDVETETVNLNDNGIAKAEQHYGFKNLYDIENSDTVHKILNSLKANYIMEIGKQYIIRHNKEKNIDEIALVDTFTGRVMEGRMYSAGLHQAIQAKERVNIDPENVTVATITYQSFFRLYKKLAGFSGTALTEKQEFLNIYNMVVVDIPTNKPVIRKDQPDYIFASKQAKWKYVIAEIVRRHELGQPILVGTVSVEDSELIHRLLDQVNIPHKVLNAKNHMIEAEIIKNAGQKGAVTIATNMAGRGTDIKLGEGVRELGGLYVLGTERNESRRIDNQLRGRSGRQGDPGESRFFISLQDSLFKRFATDKFDKAQYKMGEEMIDLKFFSRLLDKTQKRVEDMNFDSRKGLIDYDYVLSEQRELVYKQRNTILSTNNMYAIVSKMVSRVVEVLIANNRDEENIDMINAESLMRNLKKDLGITLPISIEELSEKQQSSIAEYLNQEILKELKEKYDSLPKETANELWRAITLASLDSNWTKFLDKIEKLKQGVHLRSYEQKSPLNIYVEDSDRLFYNITIDIAEEVLKAILNGDVINQGSQTEFRFVDNSNVINSDEQMLVKDSPMTTNELTLDDIELSEPIMISEKEKQDMEDNKAKVKDNIDSVVDQIMGKINEPTEVKEAPAVPGSVPPPIPTAKPEETKGSVPPPIPTAKPAEEDDFMKQILSAVDSIDTKPMDLSGIEKMIDEEIESEKRAEQQGAKVEEVKPEPKPVPPVPPVPPMPAKAPEIKTAPVVDKPSYGPSNEGKFTREDSPLPESYNHNIRIERASSNIDEIQKELDEKRINLINERYSNIISVKDENIKSLTDRAVDLEKEIESEKLNYSKQIEDIYQSENDELKVIKSRLEGLLADKERMEKDLYAYRLKEMEAEQQKIADERDRLEQERRLLQAEREQAEARAQQAALEQQRIIEEAQRRAQGNNEQAQRVGPQPMGSVQRRPAGQVALKGTNLHTASLRRPGLNPGSMQARPNRAMNKPVSLASLKKHD